ncbi:hypothetical protein IG631_20132 [Alternaria alternata]|jgi:hypothetical protein|nr:hypothetical protein IG631_20132 [Alternaria alternata]
MPLSTIVTLIKALLHAFVIPSISFDRHTNDNDLANPRLDGSPPSVVYGTVRLMLICRGQPWAQHRDVSCLQEKHSAYARGLTELTL